MRSFDNSSCKIFLEGNIILLMSYFGVELNAQVNRLIFDMRLHLSRNKYAPNLRTIYRSFVQFDPQVSGRIQTHHFQQALNKNGIFMKKVDVQLFQKILNKDNFVDWFEFLRRLREPMGPLRQELVEHIFSSMDKDNKGSITVDCLMQHFNPSVIESFQTGKMTTDQVRGHFLSLIVASEGAVSKDEFVALYNDLNVNFPHNDIFFRFVSSQWHYTHQKIAEVHQQQIRNAVKTLRYKLIEKTQGSKDEFVVRKLFDEFDCNKNFYLSSYDLSQMLIKNGMQLSPALIERVHERLDKNGSGYIEFEEFKYYIYYETM